MGAIDEALAVFRWRAHGDPEASTQFIHRAKDRRVTCEQLVALYKRATTTGHEEARFAALLTLSRFTAAEVGQESRQAIATRLNLAKVYATDPSSAIHSASRFLLRAWELPVEKLELPDAPVPKRNWMVIRLPQDNAAQPTVSAPSSLDMTFIRIPGSTIPTERRENKERKDAEFPLVLDHEFWMSECEVTVGQFRRFHDEVKDADSAYRRDPLVDIPAEWKWEGEDKEISPSATHPVQQVNWEDAVLFCNWLSWRTQRKPCYRRTSRGWERTTDGDGFRLPSELEWEYACRSGSVAQYGFGSDKRLLGDYAIFDATIQSQSQPVGNKRPNAWGLHDMHGNAWEWCEDEFGTRTKDGDDRDCVVRSGSWLGGAGGCRSAFRFGFGAGNRIGLLGFRACLGLGPVAAAVPGTAGPGSREVDGEAVKKFAKQRQ